MGRRFGNQIFNNLEEEVQLGFDCNSGGYLCRVIIMYVSHY